MYDLYSKNELYHSSLSVFLLLNARALLWNLLNKRSYRKNVQLHVHSPGNERRICLPIPWIITMLEMSSRRGRVSLFREQGLRVSSSNLDVGRTGLLEDQGLSCKYLSPVQTKPPSPSAPSRLQYISIIPPSLMWHIKNCLIRTHLAQPSLYEALDFPSTVGPAKLGGVCI